jgi:elongation factor G
LKNYETGMIRNICLVAHSGSGKTSLAEAMLFNTGAIDRLGKTDEGNTTCDHDPEEIKRRISITTSLAPCEWKNMKINILDTPGYFDFVGEVKGAMRVADGCVIVTCAVSGLKSGLNRSLPMLKKQDSRACFLLIRWSVKMQTLIKVLEQIREFFGLKAVPFQLPIGSESQFQRYCRYSKAERHISSKERKLKNVKFQKN